MSLALKLALGPLLAWQAVRTRRRVPRLPEAEGPRSGTVGRGAPLRLLVAGDSSAAGVGVRHQDEALAAPLARELAARTGRRVQWQLLARSGLNTAQTLEMLRLQCARADVAVVVTGVNDVVEQVPSQRAVRQREAMATWLRHHGGVRHVAFLPLPPMHAFEGLPQPLRAIAGSDARRHDRALRQWAGDPHAAVSVVPVTFPLRPGMMAEDGFHPGAGAYRVIVEAVAGHLAACLDTQPAGHGRAARAVSRPGSAADGLRRRSPRR